MVHVFVILKDTDRLPSIEVVPIHTHGSNQFLYPLAPFIVNPASGCHYIIFIKPKQWGWQHPLSSSEAKTEDAELLSLMSVVTFMLLDPMGTLVLILPTHTTWHCSLLLLIWFSFYFSVLCDNFRLWLHIGISWEALDNSDAQVTPHTNSIIKSSSVEVEPRIQHL